MGAWGYGSFENDTAGDWKDACIATTGTDFIKDTLLKVINFPTDDYLDADDCLDALAAAETLAALKNGPTPDLPEDVKIWVSEQYVTIEQDLIELALQAIDRIMTDSELKELWEEGDEPPLEWYAVVDDLRTRLKQ